MSDLQKLLVNLVGYIATAEAHDGETYTEEPTL